MKPSFPRLLGDIGGTNARFALCEAPSAAASQEHTLATAAHATLADAIEAYLARITGPRPLHGAIGIATAVTGDRLEMTNLAWRFSIESLTAQLGFERLDFINDFTALAHSLPALQADDLVQVGGDAAVANAAIGLIGAGTGLGVSGLVPNAAGYGALSGEGGHVTLSATDAWEDRVIAALRERFGHVSAERVLSGPGLVALHGVIAELMHQTGTEALSPAQITERGLSGDCAVCRCVLDSFCAFLGSVAGNLALTLGARGGIYIGGGIVPRLARISPPRRFDLALRRKADFPPICAPSRPGSSSPRTRHFVV